MTVTPKETIIPSSAADRKVILDAIKEADNCLLRIDSEKDQIKAIVEEINEKYELNKGLFAKLVRLYHKQNLSVYEQETSDVIEAYNTIVG